MLPKLSCSRLEEACHDQLCSKTVETGKCNITPDFGLKVDGVFGFKVTSNVVRHRPAASSYRALGSIQLGFRPEDEISSRIRSQTLV